MADVIFFCYNNSSAGILYSNTVISATLLSNGYTLSDYELAIESEISGTVPGAAFVNADDLIMTWEISGDGIANVGKTNWVGWSKIGEANFVMDLVNDAGFKPMTWPGHIYQILKLGNKAVVYGSGGVTMMIPVSAPYATFAFKEVYGTGVKNRMAVAGDEFVHFFIDDLGKLVKLSEGLEFLGYEEFLLPLTNPKLLWDSAEQRLYISDEDQGYVYNESALTGGYANLTGLYRVDSALTLISSGEIEAMPVSVMTDTFDFRYRGLKSIEALQFDVECDGPLYAAIDYRYRKDKDFKTTRWTALNHSGVAHLRTTGTEFRIRLKSLVHLNFKLSYVSIQYKFIDRRYSRGPIGETGDVNVN